MLSSAGAVVFCGAGCSVDVGPGPTPTDGGTTDAGKTDAGTDAGYDGGTSDGGCAAEMPCTPRVNACGMNCGCIQQYNSMTMMFEPAAYCDPDIGNPCPLGCFNPKEADGGRQYMGGTPVCLC